MKTTKENYFDRVKAYGVSKLPEKLQKVHAYITNATQNGKDWSLYKSNEKITQLIDAQFSKLDEVFEKSAGAEKKSSPPVEKKSAGDKKQKSPPEKKKVAVFKNEVIVKKEVVQRSSKTPAVKPGEAVESLDPHLVILGQYLNLSKKQVPVTRVSSFARRLTRMIENRTLRKASPHSKHIEKMRDNIMHILETTKGAMANVHIGGSEKSAIEKVIAQQHKMKSVQLLSRYAGMAQKPIAIEKAKRLYNTMFVTVEREEIPQSDRYFERVIETMKFLKKYVEANNEKKFLPLLSAELSGILGCGCKEPDEQPKSLNGIESEEKSGKDELQSEVVSQTEEEDSGEGDSSRRRIVNSMEFVNQHFDLLPIDEPYRKLFMPFARGAYFMIYGMDKQGKSALCIDFAGYLAQKFGEVLYVASEEGLSPTLQVKLTKFGRPAYKLDLADFLPDDLSGYNFLFLDSVTDLHLTPEDLHNIRIDYPDLTIFAIFHVNKQGRHAGKNTYAHNVEQKIHIIGEGMAESTGRYGKSETVNFFNWGESS